jgi:hypothetical protein
MNTAFVRDNVTYLAIALHIQQNCTTLEKSLIRNLLTQRHSVLVESCDEVLRSIFFGSRPHEDICSFIYCDYVPDIFDYIDAYIRKYTQPLPSTPWDDLLNVPSVVILSLKCRYKLNKLASFLYLDVFKIYNRSSIDSASVGYTSLLKATIYACLLSYEYNHTSSIEDKIKALSVIREFPYYDFNN